MANLPVKSPIISEKCFSQVKEGKFSFSVSTDSSKNDVKRIVEKMFKVNVVKINSQNQSGKAKKTKGMVGMRSDTKKMIVTLKHGQKIDLFETKELTDKKNKKTKK